MAPDLADFHDIHFAVFPFCRAMCSDAQSKCGGRAIKGRFRRTIGENIGDRGRTLSETERTLSETERTIGETDARSGGSTHIR